MTGETLKKWRLSHGLNQKEAAELFNVHHITYVKWENGTILLQGAALRLAEILETSRGMRLVKKIAQGKRGHENGRA